MVTPRPAARKNPSSSPRAHGSGGATIYGAEKAALMATLQKRVSRQVVCTGERGKVG